MSKIRVCAITFDWYPFDPLVRRMSEAAVDGDIQMDVISLRQKGEKSYELCNGVAVHRLSMDRGFGRSLLATLLNWCWFTLLAGWTVAGLHLKRRYDVIHVHNMPDFLVFSALVPRLFGAKVILHVQDVSPELLIAKSQKRKSSLVFRLAVWQERISTVFAHHVITVGWPFEELLMQRGVPKEKLTIVLNSADPKIFPSARRVLPTPYVPTEAQSLILMYHGTLSERNGLDIAIRALSLALPVAPHIRLDIMGRGEHMSALEELVRVLGISDHVTFRGPCPSDEIVDFILHGDVGIIPYRSDGFMELVLPTKSYEFTWLYRPIISSDTPAVRSMFRPESILLCNPSEPQSFADAIVDLYEHPEKLASMVRNASEDYVPYKWENMAERYRQLLRSLCNKEPQAIEEHSLVKESKAPSEEAMTG